MHAVFISTSAKTGTALALMIAFIEAAKSNQGV